MADMFEGFVEVYSTATGAKQMVPEHYVGDPVLGKGLKRVPSDTSRDTDGDPTPDAGNTYTGPLPDAAATPSDDWTVPQLTDYATANSIELSDATKKADVLAAITDHLAAGEATTGTAVDAGHTEGV